MWEYGKIPHWNYWNSLESYLLSAMTDRLLPKLILQFFGDLHNDQPNFKFVCMCVIIIEIVFQKPFRFCYEV